MMPTLTTSHTPGPWTIEPDRNDQLCIYGPYDEWIALLPHQCLGSIEAQQKINARLIAAAPTLRSELELAADTFRDFSNVLRAIGKDTMSAAADVAERHIREYLASLDGVA